MTDQYADIAAELHSTDLIEQLYAEGCRLLDRGLPILPANSKNPCNAAGRGARAWPRVKCDERRLLRGLHGAQSPKIYRGCRRAPPSDPGICLRMGRESRVIDIETDSPEERAAVEQLFQGVEPPKTVSFTSTRGRHDLYRWDDRLESLGGTFKYRAPGGGSVTIRVGGGGKGSQSAIPPTPGRTWAPGRTFEDLEPAPLPEKVVRRLLEQVGSRKSPRGGKPRARRPGQEDGRQRDDPQRLNDPKRPSSSDDSQRNTAAHESRSPHDPTVYTEYARHNKRGKREKAVVEGAPLPESVDAPDDPADAVELAIERTIPTRPGARHVQLFQFARQLKAIPQFAEDVDAAALKPVVRRWHAAALPNIATQSWEETWIDFLEGWDKVEFPAGEEPIREIYREALSKPLPECANEYGEDSLRRLVGLCAELQRRQTSPGEPFYLDCRTAGTLLEISHTQALKRLHLLEREQVLERASTGRPGKASEYRYVGGE